MILGDQAQLVVLIVATAFVTLVMSVLAMMFYIIIHNRTSRYDQSEQRAILSEMRASYEHQIAKLVHQMTATEARWREVNHLLLSAQQERRQREALPVQPESAFLRHFGFTAADYVVDQTLIVLLTPFSVEEQRTYELIRDICSATGFRCVRGDEEYTPSEILPHIIRLMMKARIVIANVASRNPNVLYELGIAHALSKQTILVAQNIDGLPFDISGLRVLVWTRPDELRQGLTEALLRTVANSVPGRAALPSST
jgi:hypothetical protein